MGFFKKQNKGMDFENIASVVILEQTQLYKNKSNWGMSFGQTLTDGQVFAMDGSVPVGSEIKFSITYRNGTKEIFKTMSGTNICDKLLQLAMDPPTAPLIKDSPCEDYTHVSIGKNELPAGKYLIGKDIPEGTYDFTWRWGNGSITKFTKENDTTLGATSYFQWVGNTHDYEFRQCLNVQCSSGEVLVLDGNMILGIAKSKPIELDL